jgi:signal transduction histidine kinase
MIPRVTAPSADRLRQLVDAGIALNSDLTLDGVLQRIVETAATLTGARYVALGVLDRTGGGLERFVTTGVDEETRQRIGVLPSGRGILGVVIADARPLRLHDLTTDPRAAGFPPHHPPMHAFLGVPIMLRGVAYGNLYLCEKHDGADFTEEDEGVTRLLAAQAAVAVENARLYEAQVRWQRQLESLNELGGELASEFDLDALLGIVARRLRSLVGARIVGVALLAGDRDLRVHAADGDLADELRGVQLSYDHSKSWRVLERRCSEIVDDMASDPEVDREAVARFGGRTGLWVPLVVRDRQLGVLLLHDKLGPDLRFDQDDLRLAETFADRTAVAVDLSARVARDAFRRVVEAQELERRRLARELHDETGQALTSILLGLRAVEDAKGDAELRTATGMLRALAMTTLQDVRRLAVELRPKALDDFGLAAALERLGTSFAEQTGIAVDISARIGESRLAPEIETALYRIVQEALTNVAKHAQARRISVVLNRSARSVVAVIEDDGRGFTSEPESTDGLGLGLIGMQERVSLLSGRIQIESTEGSGTTLVVEVPLQ